MASCFVLFGNGSDDYNRVPWLLVGIALAVYNIMDSMDGIVARLEQIPSCEGEVLDHMIDAVCTVTPLASGWMFNSPQLMSQRMYLGHSVFLLSHIHHRFSGGPLVQGIMGFGVDAAEVLGALISIVWFFRPPQDGWLGGGILFFCVNVVDWMSIIGIFWFGYLCLHILWTKKCWEMLNEDLLLWISYATLGYVWSPAHVAGQKTMSWQFICIVFTISLFFYRTLYQRLAKNKEFADKHRSQFELVGWITRAIVLLQIVSVLPVPIFEKSRRSLIFPLQAILAFGGSISSLLNTHWKGPQLPKVRPTEVHNHAH